MSKLTFIIYYSNIFPLQFISINIQLNLLFL